MRKPPWTESSTTALPQPSQAEVLRPSTETITEASSKKILPRNPFFGFHFRYYTPGPLRPVIHFNPYRGYYKRRKRSEGSKFIDRDFSGILDPPASTEYITPTASTTSTGKKLVRRGVVTVTEYPVEATVETIKVPAAMRSTRTVTVTQILPPLSIPPFTPPSTPPSTSSETPSPTSPPPKTIPKRTSSPPPTSKPTGPPSPSPLPPDLAYLRPPSDIYEPPGITPCPCSPSADQMKLTLPHQPQPAAQVAAQVAVTHDPPAKRQEPGESIQLTKAPVQCPCVHARTMGMNDDTRKEAGYPYYKNRRKRRAPIRPDRGKRGKRWRG
ncbi:hypothetical protein TWF481_003702 [Arthrobotrys musiformis]|uniref:Uncharacterized protein n=1 Tax=Arthrobotrys musiformis TaxID=47236 RepID=A0AAV9WIM2_9PEZI